MIFGIYCSDTLSLQLPKNELSISFQSKMTASELNIVAGTTTPVTITSSCTTSPPGNTCEGEVTFNLIPLNGLEIAKASTNAGPCQLKGGNTATCPVLVKDQEQQPLLIEFKADSKTRGKTQLDISAVGNFIPYSASIPLNVITEGKLIISQVPNPTFTISGAKIQPLTSKLVIINTGPSAALNVKITQQFATGIGADLDKDSTQYCNTNGQLECQFESITPEESPKTVSYRVTSNGYIPSGVYNSEINLTSDLNNSEESSLIIIWGKTILGYQVLPDLIMAKNDFQDQVKFMNTQPILSESNNRLTVPVPLTWSLKIPAGIIIKDVVPGSKVMTCSHTSNEVKCSTPNFGGTVEGSGDAAITLYTNQAGNYQTDLSWTTGTYGTGETTVTLNVY